MADPEFYNGDGRGEGSGEGAVPPLRTKWIFTWNRWVLVHCRITFTFMEKLVRSMGRPPPAAPFPLDPPLLLSILVKLWNISVNFCVHINECLLTENIHLVWFTSAEVFFIIQRQSSGSFYEPSGAPSCRREQNTGLFTCVLYPGHDTTSLLSVGFMLPKPTLLWMSGPI